MANYGDEDEYARNGDTSPIEMEAPLGDFSSSTRMGISPKAVDDVMYSDIGINVLLTRLKQSIASVRDFAGFLKKRGSLEEDHAQGLKKLSRTTFDAARRHDARQGSYALQLADMSRAHERMADHGIQFALSLQQMHDDLTELSNNIERGRKQWKQQGLNSEKKVKDAESALEKAKSRYDTLAEDYDRARTGDKASGKVFTVKGPKSAEKHEEDLLRKLQLADTDYGFKVHGAQSQRQENIARSRPEAVKALQELIRECDSGLTLQMQKFAAFNEKLLVGNGLVVSPVKDGTGDDLTTGLLSMREMVQQIDNERDFQTFVTSHTNNVPPKPTEIRYEKHPTLVSPAREASPIVDKSPQTPQAKQAQPLPPPPQQQQQQQPQQQTRPLQQQQQQQQSRSLQQQQPTRPLQQQQPPTVTTQSPQTSSPTSPNLPYGYQQTRQQATPERSYRGPSSQQYQTVIPTASNGQFVPASAPAVPKQSTQYSPTASNVMNGAYPSREREVAPPAGPLKPVFGVSLDSLFRRDESAVPMVVYQCIQAVDLFGLEMEGVYRLSGNAAHISQLKTLFDTDSSRVDFRNPENFHHDVNSVAGLLKQFFRDLPDPLMTTEFYGDFIEAARIDDDIVRRDSLHAVINSLPDPNYATLRALILHLNRVQEHAQANRMSTSNLAICFAPTIMGQHTGPHMADAGLQARVVDTILQNTYQIFDEE